MHIHASHMPSVLSQPILDSALPCFLSLLVLLSAAFIVAEHTSLISLPPAGTLHAAASRVNAMALAVVSFNPHVR